MLVRDFDFSDPANKSFTSLDRYRRAGTYFQIGGSVQHQILLYKRQRPCFEFLTES